MDHELKVIPIKDIRTIDRFRKDFGNIEELKKDIAENSLIQPVAVVEEKGGYILLAGERRLKACTELKWQKIPAKIYPKNTDELKRRAIELSENIKRKDMSWQEEAALIYEIDKLYRTIYGEGKRQGARTDLGSKTEGWGLVKTAELIGKTAPQVSNDINLYKASQIAPELLQERTKSDAMKRLKGLRGSIEKELEADRIKKQIAKTPESKQKRYLIDSFIVGDVLEGISKVPSESVDMIELDPPYGINLNDSKKLKFKSERTIRYHDIPQEDYPKFIMTLLKECYRILKNDRWITLWFAQEPWEGFKVEINKQTYRLNLVRMWLEEAGFCVRPLRGQWYKHHGQTMQPKISLANDYEVFYYAMKGNAIINKPGSLATFYYTQVNPSRKTNDAERPIEMYTDFLYTFVSEGATICSPCLGSGNVILAASNIACRCFGWDNEEDNKNEFIIKVNKSKPGDYNSYE